MFFFKKYDRQSHVWSFMTKYLRFLCNFTSWSCGCIEKQIRCWKNCWYSYNIDKCNKILCFSSRNMIDKAMCEVLWRNISDFYVILRVEVAVVSRNRYGVEKTVDTHKILTPHGKKMHVKEIYVIFIHLFDSGILLIIDLNKKKGKMGGGILFANFTIK